MCTLVGTDLVAWGDGGNPQGGSAMGRGAAAAVVGDMRTEG